MFVDKKMLFRIEGTGEKRVEERNKILQGVLKPAHVLNCADC